ncbi:MAG: SMP-30/gluconolactonase/LRE family protein [Anaerolineae bacterium]
MQVRTLINLHCDIAEGPLWDEREQILYWVDILAGHIHRFDPRDESLHTYTLGQPVGTFALREKGGMITALASGFATFDPSSGVVQPIANPEAAISGNRYNDGKACPKGYFWAGTMAYSLARHAGSLYRLKPDGSTTKIMGDVTISNGMGWSPDHKTMYYADTIPGILYAFDYEASTGDVANRRVIWNIPSDEFGSPDGLTVDAEGMLWIAFYNGSCVRRWNPNTGEVLQTIDLPTRQITSCTFGGPNLNTLYITSASEHMTPEQKAEHPLAGALFAVDLPVQGLPMFRFNG